MPSRRRRRAALQALVVTGGGGLVLLAGAAARRQHDRHRQRSQLALADALRARPGLSVRRCAWCWSAPSPSRRSSRSTSGCPTPWRRRPRSRPILHSATMVKAGVYLLMRLTSGPGRHASSGQRSAAAVRRRHPARRRGAGAPADRPQADAGLDHGRLARAAGAC